MSAPTDRDAAADARAGTGDSHGTGNATSNATGNATSNATGNGAGSAPARHLVLSLSCPDQPGIVHAVTGLLVNHGGNITESQQFGDAGTGLFFMRVQVETQADPADIEASLRALADAFHMHWTLDDVGRKMRTLILVSKEAHCLTDLLFRQRNLRLPIEVAGVVGNHPDLQPIATFYGAPFHHVPVAAATKAEAEARLLDLVAANDVELVVLARYMQILSDDLCSRLSGRIINIHHSFLPSFKGARPYAQAHARGVKLIGATAHYVTADLDEGPIIEQDIERVNHTDDVRELVAVGQDVERRVLARAVRWHAEHRVFVNGSRTVVFR
ncbi:MAG: formyltetrahydrofolate deformylase [Trueperaceae bacterium]